MLPWQSVLMTVLPRCAVLPRTWKTQRCSVSAILATQSFSHSMTWASNLSVSSCRMWVTGRGNSMQETPAGGAGQQWCST